jgi:hypothetical protein
MKLTNTLLALGLAALPASALALDDTNLFGPGLLRDDAADLVKKLGDKDYKVRRDAFKKLEAMGDSARAALETAAKGDDAEIRWNASRLLDRLDDSAPAKNALKVRAGAQADADDGKEGDHDAPTGTAPRRHVRFFGNDELQQQMQELEQRMQEFEKQIEKDGSGFFHVSPNGIRMFEHPFGFGLGGSGTLQLGPGSVYQRSLDSNGKSESLSIKVDANGHVAAEQTVDGKTTKYEADSLDQLQKEHPDLLRAGPAVIAIRPGRPDAQEVTPHRKVKTKTPLETPKDAKAKDAQDAKDAKDVDGDSDAPAKEVAPPKPKLGVELAPVPPAIAEYLELEGDALQVVRVVEDMPAAKRGLKARDILLEVDGKPVHAFEDVLRALEGADPMHVPLVVLRHGEKKKL